MIGSCGTVASTVNEAEWERETEQRTGRKRQKQEGKEWRDCITPKQAGERVYADLESQP